MLSRLYNSFFKKKSPCEGLQRDKKSEALPRAYFISDERVNKKSAQYQFIAAASSGQIAVMKKLLSDPSQKMDIEKLSEDQQKKWFDALSAATLNGQEGSVAFLLTKKREKNPHFTITGKTFECAIIGNQISVLKQLIDVADCEELRQFAQCVNSYVVNQGSTPLAAALRQPATQTIVYSLLVGTMGDEESNSLTLKREYSQKLKEIKPVHSLLVKIFNDRVKELYQHELPVTRSPLAEIPPLKPKDDLQGLTFG